MGCQHCGGRTGGAFLCNDCVDALRSALAELPWLQVQVRITASRQDRLSCGPSGRSNEHASPINWGAAQAAQDLEAFLLEVCTLLPDPGPCPPIQRALWVGAYVGRLLAHPHVGDVYARLLEFTGDPDTPSDPGRLLRAINKHMRIFAGYCPMLVGRDVTGDPLECGELLYAGDEDQYEICCPRCGGLVNVARNRSRALMDRDLLPEARLLEVMADLGETLSKERLYRWLKAGRLQVRGYLHESRIVERRVSSRDARLLSLSRCRHLRIQDQVKA